MPTSPPPPAPAARVTLKATTASGASCTTTNAVCFSRGKNVNCTVAATAPFVDATKAS
jgi:hypothetical protein